nr:MAG TPA: hypothetical protein [Caudoviricetes sp.]
MRTKWQSGTSSGNNGVQRLRGNRLHRQREVRCGESQPDLCRRITFCCCR